MLKNSNPPKKILQKNIVIVDIFLFKTKQHALNFLKKQKSFF
jgi:hypothetical protein